MKVPSRIAARTSIAIAIAASSPTFAGLATDPVAMRAGNWKVVRSIDPMKDTVSCTGIYKDNIGIQLTDQNLFITVQGGIESVTLRIDEFPAGALRLPTSIEKKIGSVIINGFDFDQLARGNRLRYQVSTLVRGLIGGDLDLIGIGDALYSIRTGCPIVPPAAVEVAAQIPAPLPPVPPPAAAPAAMCSDILMARMKAHAITPRQIQAICKP
jgi:hypothetical protein